VNEGISFTRLPYDDSAWHVEVRASSGTYSAAQEFYVYPADLAAFSQRLIAFPRDIRDEVRYELGSRTENWAYYLLLRAFVYDSVGHAALEFAADNRCSIPGHAQASFFIPCEAAALNRLGEQLHAWTRHSDEPLNWKPRNT
jgi:hypothetical protein